MVRMIGGQHCPLSTVNYPIFHFGPYDMLNWAKYLKSTLKAHGDHAGTIRAGIKRKSMLFIAL